MQRLSQFLDVYLGDAHQQLDEFNARFVEEVGRSSRPFVEDVLGAFAASLDVLRILREEVDAGGGAPDPAPLGAETVTLLSDAGEIEYISASVTELFGYAREELVGRTAFELVHPDDLGEVQRKFREASEDGRRVEDLSYRYRHRDGSWRAVTTRLQCIRHPRHPGLVAHSRVGPRTG